ncbi:hypothetical protein GURKE_02250 [Brevundimonas phage vB_BpoS-Gurke]|uniref:Uncharacterized protein n=1 Tax=Brevundimonas phage vB_BpoS-Gurke TaxID=2948599 RepID=A0A9E7N1Q1_9CAUD|nr:hypothetical protein GURKE_02250 [Brevundimonas phage vB_BpoS-Gurke]
MKRRYLVMGDPNVTDITPKPFAQKGLAFAYARRLLNKLPDGVRVEEQIGHIERPGATFDAPSGLWWRGTIAWTFLPGGDMSREALA